MAINFAAPPKEPAPKRRKKPNGIGARAIAVNAGGGLLRYEAAVRAIADAKSVDEVKDIRDTAEALRAAARVAKNKQAEIDMAEIRIRGERRLGELMELQRKTGLMSKGAQGTGSNQHVVRVANEPAPPTLAEAGIDKNLADRARKFAAIPEREFEGILADRRDRFQQEDERVTVNLMEAGEKHVQLTDAEREFEALQNAWDRASGGARKRFLQTNNLSSTVDPRGEAVSLGNDKRVNPASALPELIGGNTDACSLSRPTVSNSSRTVPTRAANTPGAAPPPAASGDKPRALSKADQIRLLRPFCKHADDLERCAGSGRKHCRDCEVREAA
jgi:hypothetical protein